MPAHHRADGAVKPESDCRGMAREGGPAGAVAKPRGRPEAVTARSAALRGLILRAAGGKKKVAPMPICPLLSPFLLRETVLY